MFSVTRLHFSWVDNKSCFRESRGNTFLFLKKNIFLFFLPPFILFSIFPVHGNQCPSARVTDFRAKTTPALPWKVPLLDVCVWGRVDRRDARVGGGYVSWFKGTKKVPQTSHDPTHVRNTGSNRKSTHHNMWSCHDKHIRHSTHSTRMHGGTVNTEWYDRDILHKRSPHHHISCTWSPLYQPFNFLVR